VWRSNSRRSVALRHALWGAVITGILILAFVLSPLWAVDLGPGNLDIGITVAGAWDDNVNYTSEDAEHAYETQLMPGITYVLPVQHHELSMGYHATIIASSEQDANSLRQTPTVELLLDFPGGLSAHINDHFTHVQDEKKEENEELDGPDYITNQAEVAGKFHAAGLMAVSTFYRNILYRYESRAEDRNSDGHQAGGRISLPLSTRFALVVLAEWAAEEVAEQPVRNYQSYHAAGGLHFSGPARFDIELAGGYQSLEYPDDPVEEPEESAYVRGSLSVGVTSSLRATLDISTDVRADVAFSVTVEYTPKIYTKIRIGFARSTQRSFFMDNKYFVNNSVDLIVNQRLYQRVTAYAKTWYALSEYEKGNGVSNLSDTVREAREDTRWGVRAGLQYTMDSWVSAGAYGEFQQRDTNVSIPFADYQRTVIGANISFHVPK
jgi:hypothetical protein